MDSDNDTRTPQNITEEEHRENGIILNDIQGQMNFQKNNRALYSKLKHPSKSKTGRKDKKLVTPSEDERLKPDYETKDVTSAVVGDFGIWQLRIGILMSLLKLSNAWFQLNIIFMTPPQDFWCEKPEKFKDMSDREWWDISVPKIKPDSCLIYDPDYIGVVEDKTIIPLVPCTRFVYDKSLFNRTMTSDWDLVCDRSWMGALTQFVMMTGVLVGGIIYGKLADKYGRKIPLMIAILMQACLSFVASVIPWYTLFLVNWFLLAISAGGITIISFVLCMEAVGGKYRTIIPIIYQLPFGLGNTVMAFLAYLLRDWRKLEFELAALSSLYILYWFVIPESPRWLLANGQTEKAVEELRAASVVNRRPMSSAEIRRLIPKSTLKEHKVPGFLDFMRLPNMRKKTVLLSINWLCTGISFYTFATFLGGIGDNIFMTVALTGLISTLGPIVCVLVVTRATLRQTVWIFQFLTGLSFIAILLIPQGYYSDDWPIILCAGIGFASMAAFVPTLNLYAGEIYPTLGRNIGVGGVATFARIGSMAATFVYMLGRFYTNLHIIILTITTFLQMILLYPLPETKDQPLPDTLEEAEKIVKR